MNKKLAAMTIVGILALGGTTTVFAATNKTVPVNETNSKTATVEQQREKAQENGEQELTTANTKTAMTEAQAKQVALASIKDGVFTAIELEDENGVIVYGVEIHSGSNTYDVKVDANTGAILKADQGNDKEEESKTEKDSKVADKDNIQDESNNEDFAE